MNTTVTNDTTAGGRVPSDNTTEVAQYALEHILDGLTPEEYRAEYAGHPVEIVERAISQAVAYPVGLVPPACPAWCTDRYPAHRDGYDDLDEVTGALSRIHDMDIGVATVSREETNIAGVIGYGAAYVTISTDITNFYHPVNAATVRQHAADLLAAATKVEELADGAAR